MYIHLLLYFTTHHKLLVAHFVQLTKYFFFRLQFVQLDSGGMADESNGGEDDEGGYHRATMPTAAPPANNPAVYDHHHQQQKPRE
jgi:hypothetical protein